jgi:hypothetical protein
MHSSLSVLFFSNQDITSQYTYSMNLLQPNENLFVAFKNQLSLLFAFENLRSIEIILTTGRRVAAAVRSRRHP